MGKGSGFSNPNGVVVGLRWTEQDATEGQAPPMCLVAQPYLMGTAKVIEPAKIQKIQKSWAEWYNGCRVGFSFLSWSPRAVCLGTFNICTTWDIGWMDIFLWIIYAFSQESCFQASPGKSWVYYPSHFYLAYLKVLLCPGGCDSNKDSRDLLMRLWLQDILGTSAPVLTQEQDNQTKSLLR